MANKGVAKLANTLQSRMKNVNQSFESVGAELGTVGAEKTLKLDSLPGNTLKEDDYMVCSKCPSLSKGDRVLVMWTYDGDPIIIDKIK